MNSDHFPKRLYKDNYSWVLGFFLNKGFAYPSAEELTHDVFERVLENWESYRGEGHFRGWLKTIRDTVYKNEIRTRLAMKNQGIEIPIDDTEHPIEIPNPDQHPDQLESIIHQERKQKLRRALGELSTKTRQCLVLYVYQELSYRQIGSLLEISRETVKSRIHQAREKLKEILAGHPVRLQ